MSDSVAAHHSRPRPRQPIHSPVLPAATPNPTRSLEEDRLRVMEALFERPG